MRDDQAVRSGRGRGAACVFWGVVHLVTLVGRLCALGLAQQYVATLGQLGEARAGCGVSGVDQRSPSGLDAYGEGWDVVDHCPGGQAERADAGLVPIAQLCDGERRLDRASGGCVGEESRQSVGDPGRPERNGSLQADIRVQGAVERSE